MMDDKKLLSVLGGRASWPPPIWLMRQAGRYLPEYRALQSKADFLTRCLTPDLAVEITLQPIRRYGFDAAILFSDILIVPWALGRSLAFVDGEGPVLEPFRDPSSLSSLRPGALLDAVRPVLEAVRRLRVELENSFPGTALIGFAGAPFTLACYMIQGRGSREFVDARRMAYEDPKLFDGLIAILSRATVAYLCAQIEAGAEVVMLFDSWSGLLPPREFERAVVEPTRSIVSAIKAHHPDTPVIGFPRLAGSMIEAYAERTGVDGLGLDTATDPERLGRRLPPSLALQGNLDPLTLLPGGESMRDEARRIASVLRQRPHIFNLGHGILPSTPPEHVASLVEAVRSA